MARQAPDLDVDLAHLDPAARWRAWMARVEAVLFASATPVARARLAHVVARLQTHDVIAPGPRSPTPGAPRKLVTTDAFLAMFGMRSLGELGEEE